MYDFDESPDVEEYCDNQHWCPCGGIVHAATITLWIVLIVVAIVVAALGGRAVYGAEPASPWATVPAWRPDPWGTVRQNLKAGEKSQKSSVLPLYGELGGKHVYGPLEATARTPSQEINTERPSGVARAPGASMGSDEVQYEWVPVGIFGRRGYWIEVQQLPAARNWSVDRPDGT